MENEKQDFMPLKVISRIVMIVFLVGGLLLIFVKGTSLARFFNQCADILGTGNWMLASALATVLIKTAGALLLTWAFLLFKLAQDPVRNAIIATGSGIMFLLIAVLTVSHFFSREIISVIPPFLLAGRVLVTAVLGLLFLIWTPKQ